MTAASPRSSGSGTDATAQQGGRELVVPPDHRAGDLRQLGSRGLTIAAVGRAHAALPEVEHGIGGEPDSDNAVHEPRHIGERHLLRSALGEEGAERVVEPPRGGCSAHSLGLRWGRHLPVAARGAELDRGGQVASAVGVRLGELLRERLPGAAGPEQQPDDEADGEADRDVLDADEPDPPARRGDDVEQDHDRDCERRLPCLERHRGRREPGHQNGER